MDNKERNIKILSIILLPLGLAVCALSLYNFPLAKVDLTLIVLSIITVFFSSYLKIQLPRTKIHLTVSDALIFLSLLTYGGEVAVLLAACESFSTSLNFRREGISIKFNTIAINVAIAATATFVTAFVANQVFGSIDGIVNDGNNTHLAELLITMVLAQFVVNSTFVAIFISIKSGKNLWQVWNEYCLNALVMFIAGALLSGIGIKALHQIDGFLITVAIAISAIVYMTYRRYVDDVKVTAAKAEQAERERAEQAENHIVELQHHIEEQDRIGKALRESKEKFRHAAFHDALTDLPNRNLFMETLKFALEKSKDNPNNKFAVLFLDINRFKTINDSLGHSMGDRLILHVAKRLATSVREKDLVARFSGDEFAFILNNISGVDDAIAFAENIKQKISAPFALNGRQVFTSFSIGIAMGGAEYKLSEDVLRDADIAMYHAKDEEKDYVVFDKKMHMRAVNLLQLETDLRVALEREELCVFYQPIIELNTMKLFGFEALVRWNHPKRGLVPPSEFISVSEDTGLIVPLTLWILRRSCQHMVEWQRKSPSNNDLVVSVNLSGKHFAQKDLVRQVQRILIETGMNPACLKLELTESAVMENAERVISMLKELRALGLKLSIDDFGTGYSSLSYLHRFPIDTLKVDRSFVTSMEDGTENGEIVRTVITLAKTLRLDVVAEGIETIHQLHQLRILGCQYGQGYLFSRPVALEEAERLLDDKARWQNVIPGHIHPANLQPNLDLPHLRLAK
ncbi:MAG: EAL domain-containing protein [Acidobacteriota bacterium]|nr:EAL domain-containing protein [Acidobacteriota bacterium]